MGYVVPNRNHKSWWQRLKEWGEKRADEKEKEMNRPEFDEKTEILNINDAVQRDQIVELILDRWTVHFQIMAGTGGSKKGDAVFYCKRSHFDRDLVEKENE